MKYLKHPIQGSIKKINTKTIPDNITMVENFENVLSYICEDFERSVTLTKFLKEELTSLFGKHNTTYRGEFFYYVWALEFNNETFYIFTANRKGTGISIVVDKPIDEDRKSKSIICMSFLKVLEELITKN